MGQLQVQWDRIRRRWVLILIITLVAGAGALAASVLQGTTYTGRAALTIQSTDRSPEQDSVLATGYADFFNQPASQEVLRQKAGLPDGLTYSARVAAGSPIVYIEATGKDQNEVGDAATKMAITFRDDVKDNLSGGALRDLNAQVTDAQNQLGRLPASADKGPLEAQITDLRSRISDVEKNTQSNSLQDLQLSAGVAANSTNTARNVGAGLLGGLVVGLLLALALGRFENRIVTSSEVQDRLALETLATVGASRRDKGRRDDQVNQRLRALTNLVGSRAIPVPGSIAVSSPRPSASKSQIAVSLAALRARQGQSTLLVLADFENGVAPSELSGRAGVADFLGQAGKRLDGKVVGDGHHLLVCPPGAVGSAPTYELFSRSQLIDLLRQGRQLADLIVVDAPAVVDSPEAQVLCSVVDRTVLVVEEGQTRSADATHAVEALRGAQASVMGAVIVQNSKQFGDLGLLSDKQWRDVAVPAVPPARVPAPGRAPGVRSGGPAPAAIDAVPADRTAPISRGELDRARAAAGLPPAPADGSAAAAPQGKPAAAANGTPRPTPRRPRAEDSGPGSPSSVDAPAGSGAAAPGAPHPRPTNGSPNGSANGSPANGSPANGSANGSGAANGSPRPQGATATPAGSQSGPRPTPQRAPRPAPSGSANDAEAKPGPKPGQGTPAPGPKAAQGGAPAPAGKPAGGTSSAPAPKPAQGTPQGTSAPQAPPAKGGGSSGPGQRPAGDQASYGSRPTGSGPGTPPSPSPKPKPSAPSPSASGSAGSASGRKPAQEKKIGRVTLPSSDRGKKGTSGGDDRTSNAAPTVSLRREV